MIKMKALVATIILSAAVATPVFAKEHGRAYDRYRGAYNQLSEPSYAIPDTQEERNIVTLGAQDRFDRSVPFDPDQNGSGN
jgi:hypothetical protein